MLEVRQDVKPARCHSFKSDWNERLRSDAMTISDPYSWATLSEPCCSRPSCAKATYTVYKTR